MKIKVSEASGTVLDWLVAKCEGVPVEAEWFSWPIGNWVYSYSRDWSLAGPIIEREWLHIEPWPNESDEELRWQCHQHDSINCVAFGSTPLFAAMRCYVASKLGNEVEVPDELLES